MKNKQSTTTSETPCSFVEQHNDSVRGVLSGFDRLRLLASWRALYDPRYMLAHLCRAKVLLKDFGQFVTACTDRVKEATNGLATRTGRPVMYLQRSWDRKERLARALAEKDRIETGLIGIWSCVEPCYTYFARRNRDQKKLVLRLESGKCLHYYFYHNHPVFGFMHLRLQTWFPFQVNVCLNGRHWLARQMDAAGIGYQQRENCFTWIEDVPKAQALAKAQLQSHWPSLLQPLLDQCHPCAAELGRPLGLSYYWSVSESEYATDIMFKDSRSLAQLYPSLVHHGIKHFGSLDVLRFLGRPVPVNGRVHGNYEGEVLSTLKTRPEGIRLKHQAAGNSLKLYDKQGSVLRVETTVNQPHAFRVYRSREKDPQNQMGWYVLRKSIADLHRRAEVCHAANNRYLDALSSVKATTPLKDLAAPICKPTFKHGHRFRALNPWSQIDGKLLEIISRGEWTINGFGNRDLRQHLFPHPTTDTKLQKQRAAKITRLLGLLRAHGIIKKVSGTHRYILTQQGRQIVTALLAARQASTAHLSSLNA